MSDQSVSVGKTKGFTLPRAAVATIVPAGHQVTLAAGDRVTLLQALGATATVTTRDGEMARLSRQDSIDFRVHRCPGRFCSASDAPFSIDRVWEAATTVYDPEIPVDIVELGLVYRVDAEQLDGGGWHVDIDMSVTAPFCGMGDILRLDLRDAVAAVTGVETVDVKVGLRPSVGRIASLRCRPP